MLLPLLRTLAPEPGDAPGLGLGSGDLPAPGDNLVFEAGPHLCAAAAKGVDEVLSPPRITPLPAVPPAVLGLFHHRGELIVAVSVAGMLAAAGVESPDSRNDGDAATTRTPGSRILIVRHGRYVTGLLVDSVTGILRLESELSANAPAAGPPPPLCTGVGTHDGRVILRLDLTALLKETELHLGGRV